MQAGELRNEESKLCLDASALGVGDTLKARKCSGSATQIWTWDFYSPETVAIFSR